MRKTIFLGLAAFALAGCPDPNTSTASAPKATTASAGPGPDAAVDPDFCEAKNPEGTNPCKKDSKDGRGETSNLGTEGANSDWEKALASVPPGREAEFERNLIDCDVTALNLTQMESWSNLVDAGAAFEAYAYCAALTRDGTSKTTAPTYSSPAATAGGGCEWKGRNYSPGDSIHYQSDGQILSSDLFVFGENFGNLSGKSGPWQLCECQVSVGHWGCV